MLAKFKTPTASKGTLRTYQNVWKSYASFCRKEGRRKEDVDTKDVANYLAERYNKGDSGSKINATITALDRTRRFLVGPERSLAEDPVIQELRQTAKKTRPPPKNLKPKTFFDPARIYQHISQLGADRGLKTDLLRKKVETLMVLDAAARGVDLLHTCCKFMKWQSNVVTVYAHWTKEAREASWTPFFFRCSCPALVNACTFCAMRSYNLRPKTAQRRAKARAIEVKTNEGIKRGKPFLVSTRGTPAALSLESIRKDITEIMREAGVEAPWTPHDLRGAVASKLMNLQAGEERVLQLGRWKSRNTFNKHYYKRAFYAEAKASNSNVPLRYLLRKKVTQVEEMDFEEITEKLPRERKDAIES